MNINRRYWASFKKHHSGRLLWFTCLALNEKEATEKLRERHEDTIYKLYGGPLLCQM
jgi:hypothetical protein